MMAQMSLWVTTLSLWLCSLPFTSALTLPQVISSHMVLQQSPATARIWGTTLPNIPVFVQLTPSDSSPLPIIRTFSDANGSFIVHLPPQPASLNWSVTVAPQHVNETQEELVDVAFGDVFLCSGQSNMQFSLPNIFGGDEAVRDSGNFPNIRLFTVSLAASVAPLNDTGSWWPHARGWQRSAPVYTNGSVFDYFSAICFQFGVGLFEHLGTTTPIGLMDNAYGGTRVEPWISNDSIRDCGPLQPPPPTTTDRLLGHQRVRRHASSVQRLMVDQNTPTVLFNSMVHPLLNVQMKAILWYQGESNAGNETNAMLYACTFPLMINDWRDQFNRQIPFYFVVLAPYPLASNTGWPALQVAQLAALTLPDVAVASAHDLGDPLTTIAPFVKGLHPRNKTLISERFLLSARRLLYGEGNIVNEGPAVKDIVWPLPSAGVGNISATVILRFDPSLASNAGLHLLDTAECVNYTNGCCKDVNGSALALRTSDGVVRPAAVSVFPEQFLVLATVHVQAGWGISEVWYDFSNSPGCALYNEALLPMLPFVKGKDPLQWLPDILVMDG